MLASHLQLLGLHQFALCLLIAGILADETHPAIHLGEIVGTEHKHQPFLHRMMTRHVAQRTDIFGLAVFELLLKGLELAFQNTDVPIDVYDVPLYALNALLTLVYLRIDDKQVLQPLLHILLVGPECLLLFLDFLLDGSPLPFQSTDGRIGIARTIAGGGGLLLGGGSRLPVAGSLRSGGCSPLRLSLRTFTLTGSWSGSLFANRDLCRSRFLPMLGIFFLRKGSKDE